MVNSDVEAWEGATGCGHPSGHSQIGMFLYLFIFEEFLFKRKLYVKKKRKPVESTYYNEEIIIGCKEEVGPGEQIEEREEGKVEIEEDDSYTCKDYIFFFILIFLQGSLMTSRMYLGVHSLD